MQVVKRIEIIVPSVEIGPIMRLMDKNGINGYSIIDGIRGKGRRGYRDADGLTNALQNSLILIACSEEDFGKMVEELRVLLKMSGGICLISDAHWLHH